MEGQNHGYIDVGDKMCWLQLLDVGDDLAISVTDINVLH